MAPVRRNFAHLTQAERLEYIAAVQQADILMYSDGVSYWDKQDQIHQSTHNHGGNSFVPWHREFVNRYEALLQQANPNVALHYWDWTEDPTAASDGQGGVVNMASAALMGTMNGVLDGPLASVHNGNVAAGSRETTGSPADPPQVVERSSSGGAPGVSSDNAVISASDGIPQAQQWTAFRNAVEGAHNGIHGYVGGDIGAQHSAFEDPFVFLLHSNVDRLFAMWQTQPGQDWRLDPDQVYGDQSNTADADGILNNLQPWDGTVEFGAPVEPWVGVSPSIETKNSRHISVVRPPCYDTLPLTVTQVAPIPPNAIEFIGVVEQLPTARALRLRVDGCQSVTATASVTAPFTLLSSSVTSPAVEGFESQDLLVWVLYEPGLAGSNDSGTLTVTIAETGDVFTVDINATVVPNPDVGASLVLDTSGSMSLASGITSKTRMALLHDAAPLFVDLLDGADGIGVVRFDTDATPVAPVVDAGPAIGGVGRTAARTAVSDTVTNPAGFTAIGDGLEAAAAQLTAVAGLYDSTATIVFTDGHNTADKTVAAAASSVNSKVFAIGLGTPDQLNPTQLSDIANGTGGYLMMTGNPGPDDQIRLQKYFAQVLASATNAAVVVDPDGYIPRGDKVLVPFDLTAADIRADVIVLSEAAPAIRMTLIAPDGTTIDASSPGVEELVGDTYKVLRVTPSAAVPASKPGQWNAVLSIDSRRLRSWLRRLLKSLTNIDDDKAAARGKEVFERIAQSVEAHGVPFSLTVQARSALHLDVALTQQSRKPGAPGHLVASLTDSGIPLGFSATIRAEVTAPDNSVYTISLLPTADRYEAQIPTTVSGAYQIRIIAEGSDLRGTRFTREELRTLSVWARGDDPTPELINPNGPNLDLCELMQCLLDRDGIRSALQRNDLDPDEIAECLKLVCS